MDLEYQPSAIGIDHGYHILRPLIFLPAWYAEIHRLPWF